MRRLTRDDDGVTIIFVVVGLLAMILMGAFALDIGNLYAHRESGQNTADSSALAVALNCASGKTMLAATMPPAKTGQTVTYDISDCAGHSQVKATVTEDVPFSFMKFTKQIHPTATAKWGTISTSNVLPVTIASCEWSLARLNGNTDITLYLDDPKVDSGCNSLPGGFSQLDRGSDGQCSIALNANGTVNGDPGGDLKKQIPCVTNSTGPALPHDVLIPIYDVTALSKANHDNGQGPYPILGFAEFHITGYSFNGAGSSAGTLSSGCPARPPDPLNPKAADPKYCIRGDFIRMLAPGATVPGPSQDFGVTKVYLSS
jgi:hypothetical protein